MTRRKKLPLGWCVLAAVILIIWAVKNAPTDSPPLTPQSSACVVTGFATELCGAEARAYCALRYNYFKSTNDTVSLDACDSVGYRR